MGTIVIAGLRELGVHGVLPEEQTRPQPFEVDVELTVDLEAAGDVRLARRHRRLLGGRGSGQSGRLVRALPTARTTGDADRRGVQRRRARHRGSGDGAQAPSARARDGRPRGRPHRALTTPGEPCGARTSASARTSATGSRISRPRSTASPRTPGLAVVAVSPVYETAPVGGPPQDDYLNAVVALDTELTPHDLLGSPHGTSRPPSTGSGVSGGARARSTSTCSSSATRWWTSPTSWCRTHG